METKKKMKLSVVILTKNEQKNISECLSSVSFANEVLIIDDNSTDKTIEFARKYGIKVYNRNLNNDFSAQRNFGLEKASGEWVLFIDADERVSKELKDEMLNAIRVANTKVKGFYFKRTDTFLGRQLQYGEAGEVKLLRLARHGAGKWVRRVHERWVIKGRVGTLKSPLLHFPHPSLREFIDDINKYSTIHAEENIAQGRRSSLIKIIFWPFAHFFKNFIINRGFQDGMHGFIVGLIMSFHSFLSWSKEWQLQKD